MEKVKKVNEGINTFGKSKVSEAWSNFYSASTAWCKMRCIGWDGVQDLTPAEVDILAKVEHARWNMEQLLMGYRPLTVDEQNEVKADMTKKKPYKSEMAHFDICSFDKLGKIDSRSIEIDEGFAMILPRALRELNPPKKTKEEKQAEQENKEVTKTQDKEEPKTTDK
jgi:hypothetical protein